MQLNKVGARCILDGTTASQIQSQYHKDQYYKQYCNNQGYDPPIRTIA